MASKDTNGSKSRAGKKAEPTLEERVHRLQTELYVLQRLVGESSVDQASLPDADFRVLCAAVGDDLYGIRVDQVREIVRYAHLTRVSDVPSSVVGALNVRGEVLAVVDARRRFGMKTTRPNLSTSIVLLELDDAAVGLIVDRVTEVVTIARGTVQNADGPLARSECLAGVTTVDDTLLQILDLNRLLDLGEWERITQALSDLSDLAPRPSEAPPAAESGGEP
jgi:purine-binding chemotaxis protein CheW